MSESKELEPWQQRALMDIEAGGCKPGEMSVIMSGRNVGKSILNNNVAYKRLFNDIFSRPIEALMFDVGTVYGARYYTVEPIGGNWPDMEQWCIETFGASGDHIWGEKKAPNPAHRWYMNNRKFWFRHEKDRDWFVIRWNA